MKSNTSKMRKTLNSIMELENFFQNKIIGKRSKKKITGFELRLTLFN